MHRANKKSKYNRHLFNNLADILIDLTHSQTRDGLIMCNELSPVITELQSNNIYELVDFDTIFKDCGFNNSSKNQILLFLLQRFSFKSFKKRSINKMNHSYRNVVFNSLFHIYSDKMIQLIDEFVSKNCPDIHNHDFLIQQLNVKTKVFRKEIIQFKKDDFLCEEKQFDENEVSIIKDEKSPKTEKSNLFQFDSLLKDSVDENWNFDIESYESYL